MQIVKNLFILACLSSFLNPSQIFAAAASDHRGEFLADAKSAFLGQAERAFDKADGVAQVADVKGAISELADVVKRALATTDLDRSFLEDVFEKQKHRLGGAYTPSFDAVESIIQSENYAAGSFPKKFAEALFDPWVKQSPVLLRAQARRLSGGVAQAETKGPEKRAKTPDFWHDSRARNLSEGSRLKLPSLTGVLAEDSSLKRRSMPASLEPLADLQMSHLKLGSVGGLGEATTDVRRGDRLEGMLSSLRQKALVHQESVSAGSAASDGSSESGALTVRVEVATPRDVEILVKP